MGKVSWAHTCTGWPWLRSTSSSRLPRETLAFREELEALKFLCKDLWAAMFQKHMDGLRTNHQVGVRAGPAQPSLVPGFQIGGSGDPTRGFFLFSLPLRIKPFTGS